MQSHTHCGGYVSQPMVFGCPRQAQKFNLRIRNDDPRLLGMSQNMTWPDHSGYGTFNKWKLYGYE